MQQLGPHLLCDEARLHPGAAALCRRILLRSTLGLADRKQRAGRAGVAASSPRPQPLQALLPPENHPTRCFCLQGGHLSHPQYGGLSGDNHGPGAPQPRQPETLVSKTKNSCQMLKCWLLMVMRKKGENSLLEDSAWAF